MNKTKSPPSPLRLRRMTLGLTLDDVSSALFRAGARVSSKSALSRWETVGGVPVDVAPTLARVLRLRRLP